jgi:hypothetical protein
LKAPDVCEREAADASFDDDVDEVHAVGEAKRRTISQLASRVVGIRVSCRRKRLT